MYTVGDLGSRGAGWCLTQNLVILLDMSLGTALDFHDAASLTSVSVWVPTMHMSVAYAKKGEMLYLLDM